VTGGTRNFSHCVLDSSGVKAPERVLEKAWRTSFFLEHGGSVSQGRNLLIAMEAVPEAERRRKTEAAERAFKVFCDKVAPKRLAVRRPAANDPQLDPQRLPGKAMDAEAFEKWKAGKDAAAAKLRAATEGEQAQIRAEVAEMMAKRMGGTRGSSGSPNAEGSPQQSLSNGGHGGSGDRTGGHVNKGGKSAKQKLVDAQLMKLKKERNPLGQPVRLKLPRLPGGVKGSSSKKGGAPSLALGDGTALGRTGASMVSVGTSEDGGSQSANSVDADTGFGGGFGGGGGGGGGGGEAEITSSGGGASLGAGSSLGAGLGVGGALGVGAAALPAELRRMAELALATCDPKATPAVSAAKALVVEERLGRYFAGVPAGGAAPTVQGSGVQPRDLRTEAAAAAAAAAGPGGSGGGKFQSGSASGGESIPGRGDPGGFNLRFNVPDKLHFVAPKQPGDAKKSFRHSPPPVSAPGEATAPRGGSGALHNRLHGGKGGGKGGGNGGGVAWVQRPPSGGSDVFPEAPYSATPFSGEGGAFTPMGSPPALGSGGPDSGRRSGENSGREMRDVFAGPGGGGDGSGSGFGSAEPWDYDSLFGSGPPGTGDSAQSDS